MENQQSTLNMGALSTPLDFTYSAFPQTLKYLQENDYLERKISERLRSRQERYRSTLDFIFCSIVPEYQNACAKFYDNGTQALRHIDKKEHQNIFDKFLKERLITLKEEKTLSDKVIKEKLKPMSSHEMHRLKLSILYLTDTFLCGAGTESDTGIYPSKRIRIEREANKKNWETLMSLDVIKENAPIEDLYDEAAKRLQGIIIGQIMQTKA